MKLFSNEIVFRGHPDKMCDQIVGAILDECLKKDPDSRVGLECSIKDNNIWVFGEVTSKAIINYKSIIKGVLKDIGYNEKFKIKLDISQQSSNISQGVDVGGAGDQGMMFGYACNDNTRYLPTAQVILQNFAFMYSQMVLKEPQTYRPDGKAQITGYYDKDNKLIKIKDFVVSYCNAEKERNRTDLVLKNLILSLCKLYNVEVENFLFNPTGKFELGGPWTDSGLTGRKIVVDSYEGFAHVGGGSLNGKDPSKVDVSGAYKARELAVRFLKDHNLKWCQVQLSYAIGIAEPLAIYIDSDKGEIDVPRNLYAECTPTRMIKDLKLKEIDYYRQAEFGHFYH